MLKITTQSDYGILFISYLIGKKDFVPLSQLVQYLKLPPRFLARVASILAKNKIVISREGKVGGYKLTERINEISLYDYLKIFEGDLVIAKCNNIQHRCPWEKLCRHKNFFQHYFYRIIVSNLKKIKLKDVFINHQKNKKL